MGTSFKIAVGAALGLALLLGALPSQGRDAAATPTVQSATVESASPDSVAQAPTSRLSEPRPRDELRDEDLLGRLAAQRERASTVGWDRDPFAPPTALLQSETELTSDKPPTAPGELESRAPEGPVDAPAPYIPRLSGIGLGQEDGDRWAIVDRQVARQGDVLHSGYVVLLVERRSVTLARGEERLTLPLIP